MRMPDFLVIGAYKSGTTSLHHHLRAHPEIFVPERNEPSFWAFADGANATRPALQNAVHDRQEYLELFATASSQQLLGEVSPEYMTAPGTCARIMDELPSARLIAVLRNPVDRAYSDYLMYRRLGIETETDFGAALADQQRRATEGLAHGSYLSSGCYAEQISEFKRQFGEQLLVVRFEELTTDAPSLMNKIYSFLGVAPAHLDAAARVHNVSGVPTNRAVALAYQTRHRLRPLLENIIPSGMNEAVGRILQRGLDRPLMAKQDRSWLESYYRKDLETLNEVLDEDFSDWIRSTP